MLLQQCLLDKDDEVRERADFYLKTIESNNTVEISLPASITALERTLLKCRENQ